MLPFHPSLMDLNDIPLMLRYINNNKLFCIVGIYFLCSVLLKMLFNLDYTIPCIWKTFFGFECPGCGMTTAFSELLKLNLTAAFKTNALLFIVAPASLIYLVTDFRKFKSSYRTANASI